MHWNMEIDTGNEGANMAERFMTRMVYSRYGGPEVLEPITVTVPSPRKGQVLIRMVSTSVNGGDVQARAGKARIRTAFPPKWPKQLGMDVVGVVEQAGPEVSDVQVGDLVWGVTIGDGSYAEYIVMDAKDVARVPRGLDRVEAGALPVAATTALLALIDKGHIKPEQRVLIRGVGGVGLTAVQVAHARGAHVSALVSSALSNAVLEQGADIVYDYRDVTADSDELGTFDLIFDTAGSGLEPFRRRLADDGTMMTITADFTHPIRSIGTIAASARFGGKRTRFITGIPHTEQMNHVADAYEHGAIHPVVDSVFALKDAAQAHARAQQHGVLGKVLLTMEA
jgi:NADPH:quinone reductase-like Zn-dependent oxidoreductase